MDPTPVRPTVVVVGAGITGLTAAWRLSAGHHPPHVVVLEGDQQVGGKLRLGDLGGLSVDLGAESLLARRPEAVDLAHELGLGPDLESPRPVGAGIWSRGQVHALPAGTLMGVPSQAGTLTGLLSTAERQLVHDEPARRWPPSEAADLDVASFVAGRVGPAVVDRLVEPLLGGVYAGHAARLSLRATIPALYEAAREGRSVVEAARVAAQAGAGTHQDGTARPVFVGIRGGVGRLPVVLGEALRLRGVEVHRRTTVRALRPGPAGRGWQLVSGPSTDERLWSADAVLLATPAAPTARLLRAAVPAAAAALARVETASLALVTFLLPRLGAGGLSGSGLLVPAVDGRLIKAATFSSTKWAWLDELAGEHLVVRASVGRHGQVGDLQVDDDELAARALADLRRVPGVRLPTPLAVRVSRWGGGLPQYAVGHVDLVADVLAEVARRPGLAVAGASYQGVGVPACIASAGRAAGQLLTHLQAGTGLARR